MANLKEIAEIVGVSNGTVSRVLNYDDSLSISDEKRKLIFEVAENLNYKPPRQRKKKKKVYKVAMIHWYDTKQELSDVYYLSIRLGIEKKCSEKDVELVKIFKEEYAIIRQKLSVFDGLIAIGKFSDDEVDEIKKVEIPTVFVDSSPDPLIFDSVVIDFKKAMRQVFEFMIDQNGIKNIGYIGGRDYIGKDKVPLGERREEYFKTYLKQRGLFRQEHIYIGEFLVESGYQQMKLALSSGNLPQAFFIASDTMAIGALKALHEAKISVPDQIKIIGFNDIPHSAYLIPPLTTVKVYTEFMGETAVTMLLERFEGRDITKKSIIPTRLIQRESF